LSSVVLGFSLLTLQLKSPSNTGLIIGAWISLGGSVALSALQSLLAVETADRMLVDLLIRKNRRSTTFFANFDEALIWIAFAGLIIGLVLLLIFTSINL
jgi:hypothetical protein